jgi:hypothetical protein
MRHPWQQFRWWFLSPHELFALSNPCVTRGSSFVDDFWDDSDSVFVHDLWGHKGCLRCRTHASPVEVVSLRISESQGYLRCRIHASPVEALSLMISESIVTQFSVMIFDPAGFVCTVEFMCQQWKQFRWWFLSRQWLSFRWWFLSPHELFALSNPCVTCGSSFVDDFWDGNDLVFVDDFWVHRGCLRCRIHVSPVEAVSLRISEGTWDFCVVESMRHLWKQFRWWFLSPQGLFALSNPYVTCRSSFVDDLCGYRGCLLCRIHASLVEALSLMIFESTMTQYSVMIFEPTRAICAVESTSQPWKQFRWWFLSPQGVFALSNPCVTRGSSFVEDLWVPRAVCVVESCVTRGSTFVDDFWVDSD